MKKLISLFKWIDQNLINILLIIFVILIPLYPKIPLKNINYTYIAIRLEDLYFAILVLAFIIQLVRKKITLNRFLLKPIFIFWALVFLSLFFGIYIGKSVVYQQVGILHALRRVEYMSVFIIAASVIKSRKEFWRIFYVFIVVFAIVNLYALGQKFLNFPAVQTMNPEFARGKILYLTPEARVSSTFAGHYDLASYLVFFMPIILALFFQKRRSVFFIVFILSLTTLFYTASRISFIAYIVSVPIFVLFLRRYLVLFLILSITINLNFFTGDLTKRFLKTFQVKQILVDEKTGEVFVPQKITAKELPAGSFYIKTNQKKAETQEVTNYKNKLISSKIINEKQLAATKSGENIDLSDLKLDKSDIKMAEELASQIKSVNTVVSDISFATRLQIEWPRAINALKKNPLLGLGPSSITEATDNDYLRWLGEFGILGTSAFLFIIGSLIIFIWKKSKESTSDKFIFYGVLFGIFALLVNASYIDVFEASKVAFTFWLLMGAFIGHLQQNKKVETQKQ